MSVNTVDERIPPITTVASGRCTSDPVPTLRAIGTNPRLATSAVARTGRRRCSAPSAIASSSLRPSSSSLRMKVTVTQYLPLVASRRVREALRQREPALAMALSAPLHHGAAAPACPSK